MVLASPGVFLHIRPEIPSDFEFIRDLHAETFPTFAEAILVSRLRREASPCFSLVAECEGTLVGHLFFSPVTLEGHPHLKIMGLAPLAVQEEYQGEGIGSALVIKGLEMCRENHIDAVVVLGHATYYPRFGFQPAIVFGIECPYPVPNESFMALEIVSGSLADVEGTAYYHPAFDAFEED